MPKEVTVTKFPRANIVQLIKLVRTAACVDLMTAKHIVESTHPRFPLVDVRDEDMYLDELKNLGVDFTTTESDPNALEERRVKAMVEADDNQTSYERCRHMLRAALKEN